MPITARERLAIMLAAQDETSSSVQLKAKTPADLRLEVQGFGQVTLPVPAAQARELKALGRPAHFGRGEETLTDAAVRDTWEIPTELVRVEWAQKAGLSPELESIREELGLPDNCHLTAELHSMLVYEKGQFFLPHQDSEKDDAMVATLVVTLPSAHTGGELVVHHLGEATTYRGSKTDIRLVAFYADCRHEVLAVKSGHRITLTYNLFLQGDPAGRVPEHTMVGELSRDLHEHFSTRVEHRYGPATEPPQRLVFLLDHEYTERSLGWTLLKGIDTQRASLLRAAADAAGCETVLALTEINEIWDAEEPDAYDSRRYRRVEEEPVDEEGYHLNDLIDSSIKLTLWTDPEGTTTQDISLTVADGEVCAVTPSVAMQPYESQFEGFMGNYGNTLDRWYRRAAVVVWPKERSFANRAEASPEWAMDDLLAQTRAGDPAAARAAVATLAPFWAATVRGRERASQLFGKTLIAAAGLNDPDTATRLLSPFKIEDLRARQMTSLAELTGRYGEMWTGELLTAWFADSSAGRPSYGLSRTAWLNSLPTLCDSLLAVGTTGEHTAECLLELAWTSLSTLISSTLASPASSLRQQQLRSFGEPLAAVTRAATTQATDLRDRIVAFCIEHGDGLTSCVVAALRTSAATETEPPQNDVFRQMALDQTARLLARVAQSVRAADDWSITLTGGCTCELCGTLRMFLADQARRTFEWPLAKDRRSHIHSRIDRAELPVTHLTRRQGSPQTLVLTKTAQLFDRESTQRTQAQADANWLLEHWMPQ